MIILNDRSNKIHHVLFNFNNKLNEQIQDLKAQLYVGRFRGRRGGLMVSALETGSSDPGPSVGRGTALCSWARHFTQVYKWVPANVLLAMYQHPIQGGVEILLVASCHGNRDKLRPGGSLGSNADFTYEVYHHQTTNAYKF